MTFKKLEILFLFFLISFAIFSTVLIIRLTSDLNLARDNHLVLLAEQFSKGQLNLSPFGLPSGDYVDYFGKQFLYFGPVSSLVLIPFAAIFGRVFPQIFLGLVSLGLAFLAIYKLTRNLKFSKIDAIWLCAFFNFSTVLFAVSIINISAYQVQALGAVFVLFSLAEFFGKKRYFLIGLLIALAGMTRLTLYLSIIFFLFQKVGKKNIFLLLVPIALSVLLLAGYNYKRFHNIFESGYKYNVTANRYPMSANLAFGQFNFSHIPANIFSLLIKSPDPIVEKGGGFILKFPYFKVDPWGIAIWFTSPLLLLLFRLKKEQISLSLLITITFLFLPSLFYFGIGYSQFGYRYSLDFLPFLFLLLIPIFKSKLSLLAKILIVLGVLFNCLYMVSIWGYYPHFGIY